VTTKRPRRRRPGRPLAVVWTNIAQFLFMWVGLLVLLPPVFHLVGGWTEALGKVETVAPGWTNITGTTWTPSFLLSWYVIWLVAYCTRLEFITKVFAARDHKVARYSVPLTIFLIMIFLLYGNLYLGAAANERTVKSMRLADRKVVMFATHGLVPGDLDGLTQPALALSAPAVAGVEGDGLLTLDEILNLKLDADWVVLSACNTAAGEGAGAEALSGLGRAFFYAGTRALLASSWPVETTSARALTTELFQRQAAEPGLSRAEALRRAMLALIDGAGRVEDGRTVFSYAHPIFWAPFAIVGEPGGNPLGS